MMMLLIERDVGESSLRVVDSGDGFDFSACAPPHFPLFSISARAKRSINSYVVEKFRERKIYVASFLHASAVWYLS